MQDLQYIEIETGENPTAAVIWLHGLGASGHDFEPVVPELGLPEDTAVRFIFPHAPNLPVTINGGMSMPAWYDIKAMDIDRVVDTEQLRASADAVAKLVEQQKHKCRRRVCSATTINKKRVAYVRTGDAMFHSFIVCIRLPCVPFAVVSPGLPSLREYL